MGLWLSIRSKISRLKAARSRFRTKEYYKIFASLSYGKKGIAMKIVILLRHGESVWNKENRFTGWTDVDLTEKGVEEAKQAGELMRDAGFVFDLAHTSVLKRAIKTLWLALEQLDL